RRAASARLAPVARSNRGRRGTADKRLLAARKPRVARPGDRGLAAAQRLWLRARLRRPPRQPRAHAAARIRPRRARRRLVGSGLAPDAGQPALSAPTRHPPHARPRATRSRAWGGG